MVGGGHYLSWPQFRELEKYKKNWEKLKEKLKYNHDQARLDMVYAAIMLENILFYMEELEK